MVSPAHLWQNKITAQKIWKLVALEVLFGKWQVATVWGIDPVIKINKIYVLCGSHVKLIKASNSQLKWQQNMRWSCSSRRSLMLFQRAPNRKWNHPSPIWCRLKEISTIANCITLHSNSIHHQIHIRSSASWSAYCVCVCACVGGVVTVRYSVGRFGLFPMLAWTSTWRWRERSSLVDAHSSENPASA